MFGGDLGIVVAATLLFLIASGLWAERRFADFQKLPMHYGFSGKPTYYGSRSVAIWLPTVILIAVIVLNASLIYVLDSDQISGDPHFGVMLSCTVIAAAQVFILWLHTRWANRQA